jgi:hypothetical protein
VRVWKRWGAWKAHLYDGDAPVCPFAGLNVRRGLVLATGMTPSRLVVLVGDAIGPHGLPYGPVCSRCQSIFSRPK